MARRFVNIAEFPAGLRGGVVAIGNFDGVHRGHQAVLAEALATAAKLQTVANLLTFEPHPRTVFRPDQPVFRLTPAPLKARILGILGFDAVIEQPFDKDFAARSAEDFVRDILVGAVGVTHVVTGVDFHFGKGREGNPAFLAEAGRRHGFGVKLVESYGDEGGEVISSSRVRALLADGDVTQAAGLLGYRYSVSAEIIHGRKLGRTLGYPTANMAMPPETGLKPGVYAVRLRRQDGTLHDGVASFGRRPTVETADAALLLETYVFDASPDLYGETCTVSLFGFLRPELKFDGLEAMTAQIRRDEEEARALLSAVTPLGALDAALVF